MGSKLWRSCPSPGLTAALHVEQCVVQVIQVVVEEVNHGQLGTCEAQLWVGGELASEPRKRTRQEVTSREEFGHGLWWWGAEALPPSGDSPVMVIGCPRQENFLLSIVMGRGLHH